MSSKRDWNDVSDDESDEERHQHEEEHKDEIKDVPQELPILNKIVSSPLPDKKNPGEQENLKKLQNCTKEEVWLYVPLFYKDNINEIDQALKADQQLIKIDKFIKGWNVLTNKQNAKNYIVEGKKQGKFYIKFYFSNKNEDNENRPNSYKYSDNSSRNGDNENRKVKYVPKSPKAREEISDMKSPDFKKVVSQNDYDVSRAPKSPSYKNQQWKKDYDYRPKNYNGKPSLKREDSKGGDSVNTESRGYKHRYSSKYSMEEGSPNVDNDNGGDRKKYRAKGDELKKQQLTASGSNEVIENVDYEQKQSAQQQQSSSTGDKKPKKKRTRKADNAIDSNNPFSILM